MTIDAVDWPAMRDRIFGRIDPIVRGRQGISRGPAKPEHHGVHGDGRFIGHKTARHRHAAPSVTADRWSCSPPAAGPTVPDIPGLALGPRVHTSDTIMLLDDAAAIGRSSSAAATSPPSSPTCSASFGSEVTQVIRGDPAAARPRRRHLARRSRQLPGDRWTLLTAASSRRRSTPASPMSSSDVGAAAHRRGRHRARRHRPTPQQRPPRRRCHRRRRRRRHGYVTVDEYQRTSVDGHLRPRRHLLAVAAQARRQPRDARRPPQPAPPRAIGAKRSPLRPVGGVHPSADRRRRADRGAGASLAASTTSSAATTTPASPPAGHARTRPASSRCSPIPDSGLLLGAHVIGPEAATVIQPLIQAMSFGQTARDVATKAVLDPSGAARGHRERAAVSCRA